MCRQVGIIAFGVEFVPVDLSMRAAVAAAAARVAAAAAAAAVAVL